MRCTITLASFSSHGHHLRYAACAVLFYLSLIGRPLPFFAPVMSSPSQNNFSLMWSRESKTLAELMASIPVADEHSLLVKVQCQRQPCYCALENNEVLMVKPIPNVTLVCAMWMKNKSNFSSRTNSPNCVKSARLVLTSHNTSWYEVLNESGQSIPCWTGMKDVVRFRPRSFLLRKDCKCLLTRNGSGGGEFELQSNSTGIVKAGTVLNFLEYNKFRVLKHRKVKEMPLVKCSDTNGHLIFLNIDDKCPLSPIAGPDNISGVHTLRSLLQKFHLPISIRPVFGSPISWLPNSDRHYLRLNSCYRGDLLLIGSLRNPDQFFVVTPSMLDDHTFRVGDSELPFHTQMLEKYATRVQEFLTNCHPHESLRYLFRNLAEITNQTSYRMPVVPIGAAKELGPAAGLLPSPGYSHSAAGGPQMRTNPRPVSAGHLRRESQLSAEETDRLFDEVEDIYYYVRTGRFPDRSRSASSGSSLALMNPRTRQVEIVPDPQSAHSAGAGESLPKSCSPAGSAPRPRRMSSSCNNLMEEEENRHPPPPLPPRNYSIEDVEAPIKRRLNVYPHPHVTALRVTAIAEEERRRFSADCAPMQLRQHMQNTLF